MPNVVVGLVSILIVVNLAISISQYKRIESAIVGAALIICITLTDIFEKK